MTFGEWGYGMEGRHRKGAECIWEWHYQLNLELQFSTDGDNLMGFILYGLCVHSYSILGFVHIYEVLAILHEQMERINQFFTPLCTHEQHTLTSRCTPRPPHSLTSANTASHQVVAGVTTVGGCLSKCCSSSVINLAIGWISQIITVHSC